MTAMEARGQFPGKNGAAPNRSLVSFRDENKCSTKIRLPPRIFTRRAMQDHQRDSWASPADARAMGAGRALPRRRRNADGGGSGVAPPRPVGKQGIRMRRTGKIRAGTGQYQAPIRRLSGAPPAPAGLARARRTCARSKGPRGGSAGGFPARLRKQEFDRNFLFSLAFSGRTGAKRVKASCFLRLNRSYAGGRRPEFGRLSFHTSMEATDVHHLRDRCRDRRPSE